MRPTAVRDRRFAVEAARHAAPDRRFALAGSNHTVPDAHAGTAADAKETHP